MSWKATAWAIDQTAGGPGPKLLLLILADYTHRTGNVSMPAAETLAKDMECSRATVFRHLKALEERGLVRRRHRFRESGGQTSNEYELALPPDAESQNETPAISI